MSAFLRTVDTFQPETKSLPGRFYFDEAIFDLERERIFAEDWICVAREEELPGPGAYVLVEAAGESIILVRSDDTRVAAFYNVCRHRGSRLCHEAQGRLEGRIRCPYHAWTYDLEGALVLAPRMDEVPGFDGDAHGLHRVHAGVAGGLVFVSLAEDPKPFAREVERHFARFEPWALEDLKVRRRIDYEVEANWKVVCENFSECYHCPSVHPSFSRKVHPRSGRNDAYAGPLLGGHMELTAGTSSLTATGALCGPVLGGVDGADLARVYFYSLFPSLTISLHPDYVMTHVIRPLSPTRTLVRCEWLFAADDGIDPDAAAGFWDPINREDWEVCAGVQLGVASRSYRPSPFSAAESLPQAFNHQYVAALGVEYPAA